MGAWALWALLCLTELSTPAAASTTLSGAVRVPPEVDLGAVSWSVETEGYSPAWVQQQVVALVGDANEAPRGVATGSSGATWPSSITDGPLSVRVQVDTSVSEPVFSQDKKQVRGGSRPVYEVENCVSVKVSVEVSVEASPGAGGPSYSRKARKKDQEKTCSDMDIRAFRARHAEGPSTRKSKERLVRSGLAEVFEPVLPDWERRRLSLAEGDALSRGNALATEGRLEEAVAAWSEDAPGDWGATLNQGRVRDLQDRLDEAEALYGAALEEASDESSSAEVHAALEALVKRREQVDSLEVLGLSTTATPTP